MADFQRRSGGVFDRSDAKRINQRPTLARTSSRAPPARPDEPFSSTASSRTSTLGDTIYEPDRVARYDIVLTNPPFGTKGANQAPTAMTSPSRPATNNSTSSSMS